MKEAQELRDATEQFYAQPLDVRFACHCQLLPLIYWVTEQ